MLARSLRERATNPPPEGKRKEDMTWDGTTDETLDSRDLDEWLEAYDEDADNDPSDVVIADEIIRLRNEGITDWEYGAALIHEGYFTEYAQEFASDIGAVNDDHGWPLSYIDWDAASEALKQDYTEVSFLGATYYVRS